MIRSPLGGSRQQQVRDVGACDQQQQHRGAHQHRQRRAPIADEPLLERGCRPFEAHLRDLVVEALGVLITGDGRPGELGPTGRRRRAFVRQVALDVADGAHSLGQLDFGALCRRHRLPVPERQVLRTTPTGRVHLDVRWAGSRLVVEIDGAGHRWGLAVTDDNLRQNEVVLTADRVLRFDLLALRLHEAEVMEQVRRGL